MGCVGASNTELARHERGRLHCILLAICFHAALVAMSGRTPVKDCVINVSLPLPEARCTLPLLQYRQYTPSDRSSSQGKCSFHFDCAKALQKSPLLHRRTDGGALDDSAVRATEPDKVVCMIFYFLGGYYHSNAS